MEKASTLGVFEAESVIKNGKGVNMKVATEWLTKVYNYYWYYQHDSNSRTIFARLFQRKDSASITELVITVVDRRAEYYDKKALMRGS